MSDPTSRDAKGAAGAARDGVEKVREAFSERVVEPARRAGEAARASGKTWAEGGSAISLKMLDQAERNIREAFSAMRSAAGAKDIAEVMNVQAEFLRQQGARSMDQAREIGEMIVQVGRDAATPLTGAVKRGTATPAPAKPTDKPAAGKGARKT